MTAALKTKEIGVKEARRLVEAMKNNWLNFGRSLQEVVHKRAWVPLGYESFLEFWSAEMGDVALATEFNIHVVYALLNEGAGIEDIAGAVKGIGRGRAERIREQYDLGMDPVDVSTGSRHHRRRRGADDDTTIVREHERKSPGAADTLHIKLGTLKLKRYQRIAKKLGMTVDDIARQAVDEKFAELG